MQGSFYVHLDERQRMNCFSLPTSIHAVSIGNIPKETFTDGKYQQLKKGYCRQFKVAYLIRVGLNSMRKDF